jgi:putative transposase
LSDCHDRNAHILKAFYARLDNSQQYQTTLLDKEWRYIESRLPAPKKREQQRSVNLRGIFNTISYVPHSGCSWRMLPHDLPAWQTVYAYFRR